MEADLNDQIIEAVRKHLKETRRDPDLKCIHCGIERPAYPGELTVSYKDGVFEVESRDWNKLDFEKPNGWWSFTNPAFEQNADHEVAFCPKCVVDLDLKRS